MAKYQYKYAKYVLKAVPNFERTGWQIVCLREFDREHSEETVGNFATKKAAVQKIKRYVEKIQNRLDGKWSAPWAVRDWWTHSDHEHLWPQPDRFIVLVEDFSDDSEEVLLSYRR
jgi:hypothetical protein